MTNLGVTVFFITIYIVWHGLRRENIRVTRKRGLILHPEV